MGKALAATAQPLLDKKLDRVVENIMEILDITMDRTLRIFERREQSAFRAMDPSTAKPLSTTTPILSKRTGQQAEGGRRQNCSGWWPGSH